MKDIAIIGGGLAGLITAILCARAGHEVILFEKKSYPLDRVCGEYISNEVKDFLVSQQLFPEHLQPSALNHLSLSGINGAQAHMPLVQGGFGISRYAFDEFLYKIALQEGVKVHTNTTIHSFEFDSDRFVLINQLKETFQAKTLVTAHGKRSNIDNFLQRDFFKAPSPFIGVKYHARNVPIDHSHIALHNFKDGYCGVCKIEADLFNICYLSRTENLKKHGSIEAMERAVIKENPFLNDIWERSTFTHEKPVVINEVSFLPKPLIENHALSCGDSAGLISPLCGNGMAMAIHAATILSQELQGFLNGKYSRATMEMRYRQAWEKHFLQRLKFGRIAQRFFGRNWSSNLLVRLMAGSPAISNQIINFSHGKPFTYSPA